MRRKRFILWMLVVALPARAQQISEILGRPSDHSITVSTLFNSAVEFYVEYGTRPGSYDHTTAVTASGANEAVETLIDGLLPSTRYYYRTSYRTTGSFTKGVEHTFVTQRQKGESFRFTIEADVHPYDKKGCHELWRIALQNQLSDTADFMIDLGDTFGDDHEPFTITNPDVKQLQLNCRWFFGDACHSLPLYFCLGNHEGESGYYLLQTPPYNLATYETLWRKYFYPNPEPSEFYTGNTEVEGNGMGTPENYYAWEWGDALFVVLDMYRYYTANAKPTRWDWTIGKAQYDWLKQTLESSKAKYKFVFSHHILGQGRGGIELASSVEWGGYDAGKYKFDTYRPGWGLPIHQLMVQNKVDAYFQGHDHIYVKQDLDNIVYQTVPMPSDSSYLIGVTDNGAAFLSGIQFDGSGHLRVTVSPDSATVDYVSAVLPMHESAQRQNGKVVYSYSIKKTSATAIPEHVVSPTAWVLTPNPASDKTYVVFREPVSQQVTATIANLNGQTAGKYTSTMSQQTTLLLPFGNLQRGVYIVSVTLGNETKSYRKLIVK